MQIIMRDMTYLRFHLMVELHVSGCWSELLLRCAIGVTAIVGDGLGIRNMIIVAWVFRARIDGGEFRKTRKRLLLAKAGASRPARDCCDELIG